MIKTNSILLFYFSLLFLINITNGQVNFNCEQLNDFNGGFILEDNAENCSPGGSATLPGIPWAFNLGCVSSWGAGNGSPDLRSGILNSEGLLPILPVNGDYFASLGYKQTEGSCQNEVIFHDYEFNPDASYELTFRHAVGCGNCEMVSSADVQIALTSGITNNTVINGLGSCEDLVLENPQNIFMRNGFSDGEWVEEVLTFTPDVGQNQIVFIPQGSNKSDYTNYWAIRDIVIVECLPDDCTLADEGTQFDVQPTSGLSIAGAVAMDTESCKPSVVVWSFGDGNTEWIYSPSITSLITHTYEECGEYEVCVGIVSYCEDGEPCTIKRCEMVDIPCKPTACDLAKEEIFFDVTITGDNSIAAAVKYSSAPCRPQKITWNYDDGNTYSPVNIGPEFSDVTHKFDDCGIYNVCVVIESECPDSREKCIIELCEEVNFECKTTECEFDLVEIECDLSQDALVDCYKLEGNFTPNDNFIWLIQTNLDPSFDFLGEGTSQQVDLNVDYPGATDYTLLVVMNNLCEETIKGSVCDEFSLSTIVFGCGDGAVATIFADGGTGPYFGPQGEEFDPSLPLNGLGAGTHSFSITDSYGCLENTSFTICDDKPISCEEFLLIRAHQDDADNITVTSGVAKDITVKLDGGCRPDKVKIYVDGSIIKELIAGSSNVNNCLDEPVDQIEEYTFPVDANDIVSFVFEADICDDFVCEWSYPVSLWRFDVVACEDRDIPKPDSFNYENNLSSPQSKNVQNKQDFKVNSFNSIHIFPNPFSERIEIVIDKVDKNFDGEILILDNLGRVVKEETRTFGKGENRFVYDDLDNLAPGVYIVIIKKDGVVYATQNMVRME